MRRISVLSSIVGAALILIVGMAPAASARASVDVSEVSFTLSSATCSHLPNGTTVEGSGIEKSITNFRTDANGVSTIINATHAQGTAIDQDGNVYVFTYSNEFRASNTVDDPGHISGLMTDHFSLSGPGPATLSNGFVAHIFAAADFSSFSADPIHAHGDPITFPDGVAHCDPL